MHIVSAGPSSIAGAGLQCWDARKGQVLFSSSDYACGLTGSSRSRIAFGTEQGLQVRAFPTGDVLYWASMPGNFSLMGLQALVWSPDGAYLACGTDNGSIVLWDVVSHSIFARSRLHGSEIHALAWSPDSTYLVAGCDDAKMCVLHIANKTNMLQRKPQPVLEQVFTHAGNSLNAVSAVAWSPDGKCMIGNIGGKIYATDLSGKTSRWLGGSESTVKALAWSPDGKHIVSGHSNHVVRVWEATTGNIIKTYTGHTDRINAVAWSPDGQYIASGSQDHTVRVWQGL
jgi:WD40 repeat protein